MKVRSLFESTAQGFDFTILAKECSQFIEHDVPLYRGMKSNIGFVGKIPIRTDRRPLHSDLLSTALLNVTLECATKVPLLRAKSAFATTSGNEANAYGSLFYIFPRNGTSVVYNPSIPDSIMLNSRLKHGIYGQLTDDQRTQLTHIIQETGGNLSVEDFDLELSPKDAAELKKIFQIEAATSQYFKGYVSRDVSTAEFRTGAPVEYMLHGSPYIYAISRTGLIEMAKRDLDDPEAVFGSDNTVGSGIDPVYEYLMDLIRDDF